MESNIRNLSVIRFYDIITKKSLGRLSGTCFKGTMTGIVRNMFQRDLGHVIDIITKGLTN
jgi:hypothetical protein